MMLPASLSGGQLELFCEKQPRWMNITFGKLKAQNPAYKSSPFFSEERHSCRSHTNWLMKTSTF